MGTGCFIESFLVSESIVFVLMVSPCRVGGRHIGHMAPQSDSPFFRPRQGNLWVVTDAFEWRPEVRLARPTNVG
jgi:hypothetical protein